MLTKDSRYNNTQNPHRKNDHSQPVQNTKTQQSRSQKPYTPHIHSLNDSDQHLTGHHSTDIQ